MIEEDPGFICSQMPNREDFRLSDIPEAIKPVLSKRQLESVTSGTVMRRLSDAPDDLIVKMNFDAAVFGYNNNLKTHIVTPQNETRLSNRAITFKNVDIDDRHKPLRKVRP